MTDLDLTELERLHAAMMNLGPENIREKAIEVSDWYNRDGSVGGACDPFAELDAALVAKGSEVDE